MSTMVEQLQEQVRRVAEARRQHEERKGTLAALREAFDREHDDLIRSAEIAREQVAETEATLKALTLAHFEATGEKKPVTGVQVKEIETLKYDPTDAFAWAKTTGLALTPEKLDAKAFEKVAKATALPFVEVVKTPRAEIASELPVEVTP